MRYVVRSPGLFVDPEIEADHFRVTDLGVLEFRVDEEGDHVLVAAFAPGKWISVHRREYEESDE